MLIGYGYSIAAIESTLPIQIPISGNCISQDRLGLDDIQPTIEKLFQDHIKLHKMTPEIALRSHRKFLDFFDPEKIFLLQAEVDQYCLPGKEAGYLKEWKENMFSSFRDMIETIQKSIRRARSTRRAFFSSFSMKEIDRINQLDMDEKELEKSWSGSIDELDIRQKRFVYDQLSSRLGVFTTSSPTAIRRAIREIELEIQKGENEWLFISSEDNSPLPFAEIERSMAEKIMRAYGASLDPHSAVLSEKEAEKLKERLSKEVYGSGITCTIRNGKELVIEKIDPLSPAGQKMGFIEKGDSITALNDIDAHELIQSGKDISYMLGGNREIPKISLMVRHKKSQAIRQIALEKGWYISQDGRLSVQRSSSSLGDSYILQLNSFYASPDESVSTEKDLRRAFEEISEELVRRKKPLLGIILDLRANRGGYLLQAVKSAGLFIKSGVIVSARYADGTQRSFRDLDPAEVYTGPCVVLTSKITASAAEIVAEALKAYGVALIVGDEKTYGKGSIQMQTATGESHQQNRTHSKNCFKVTVGQYYSVSGESIQREGVHADLIVPGIWSRQQVGEKFLKGTLARGAPIQEQFHDTLYDVSSDTKEWMRKWYMPFLQKPSKSLELSIPSLQKKSRYRMAQNPKWQVLLSGGVKQLARSMQEAGLEAALVEKIVDRMQLEEALSILKDLAVLSKNRAVINSSSM